MTSAHDPPRYPESADPYVAGQFVNTPALLLVVTGALGLVGGLLSVIGNLTGLSAGTQAGEEILASSITSVVNLILIPCSVVVLWGGMRMRQLRSWGLSMAAAVIAIVPGVGSCCCLGIPVGIRALVVLNKREVKSSFL